MPATEDARPSVGVALDIDLERRPDALLALAMLHGFTVKEQAVRISLAIRRGAPWPATPLIRSASSITSGSPVAHARGACAKASSGSSHEGAGRKW